MKALSQEPRGGGFTWRCGPRMRRYEMNKCQSPSLFFLSRSFILGRRRLLIALWNGYTSPLQNGILYSNQGHSFELFSRTPLSNTLIGLHSPALQHYSLSGQPTFIANFLLDRYLQPN